MLLLSSPLLSFLLVSKVGVVRVGVLLLAGDREAGRRRQAGGGGRPRRGTEGEAARRRTRERGLAAAARELPAVGGNAAEGGAAAAATSAAACRRQRSQSPGCIIFSDTWWVIKFIQICDIPGTVIEIFVLCLALSHN